MKNTISLLTFYFLISVGCSCFATGARSGAEGAATSVDTLSGDTPSCTVSSTHFSAAAGVDIIFGPRTQGNRIPWWGRKYDSIASQHLYMQTDIATSGEITSFAWQNYPLEDMEGSYNNVRIYMGHTSLSELGSVMADNYTGPRTLVFERASFTTGGPVDTWNDIILDTPFLYNNRDNLIIEVRWNGDDDRSVLVWCGYWTGHGGRAYAFSDTATVAALDLDYVYRIKLHIEGITQPTYTPTITSLVTPPHTPTLSTITAGNPSLIIVFFIAFLTLVLIRFYLRL